MRDKFYIRVSDDSHIMYVMRLFVRADHVLSNKLQLDRNVFITVIFWYWLLCPRVAPLSSHAYTVDSITNCSPVATHGHIC
jgi:hypothetical protein